MKLLTHLTLFCVLVLSSCTDRRNGFLLVNSLNSGEYEVYKIIGETTLQFISNQIGHLNEKLPLAPGGYLVLGDCSYQVAMIHPNRTTELLTHTVIFVPPLKPEEGDLFKIQCNRHPQTHPPQHINKRFELTVFPGNFDMLVGMRALHIRTTFFKTPQSLKYNLSAIRVSPFLKEYVVDNSPYFVSPLDGQNSLTQSLDVGKWQFLLPGPYVVTLNGTDKHVEALANEAISIDPSYIKFETSPELDMGRYLAIKGEPYTAEINDKRSFAVNTIYPLISESLQYRLEGSIKAETLLLKPQSFNLIPLRSVEVSLRCGPWEWECLGKRDVSLYAIDSTSPFMHGNTDLPILFNRDDVQIEIEGAQSLRYKVPNSKRDHVFETGQIILKPQPVYIPSYLSLLVRLDGDNVNVLGQSYDIPYSRESRMNLIVGSYSLNHYFMKGNNPQANGIATTTRTIVNISKGTSKEIYFDYYLQEEKHKAFTQQTSTTKNKGPRNSLSSKSKAFVAF